MTRRTLTHHMPLRLCHSAAWFMAAVLTPALMLSSLSKAADRPASALRGSGNSIIRVAGTVEQPTTALVDPPPLITPPEPGASDNGPTVDSGKRNPRRLRSIADITPSYDYDPDGKSACEHLCPREPGTCPGNSNLECPVEEDRLELTPAERLFPDMTYMWCASNVYHNPLYFEDVQLERYGQVKCSEYAQPFVSLGKFGVQLVGLPYQMALDPPCSRRYALGYYRPGDCPPRLHYRVPLNARAAVISAPVYTGAVFLLQ